VRPAADRDEDLVALDDGVVGEDHAQDAVLAAHPLGAHAKAHVDGRAVAVTIAERAIAPSGVGISCPCLGALVLAFAALAELPLAIGRPILVVRYPMTVYPRFFILRSLWRRYSGDPDRGAWPPAALTVSDG